MNDSMHPIFVPNGHHHSTRPIERSANFVLQNVENDLHGCTISGSGGLGKSSAVCWLAANATRWLVDEYDAPIGVCSRFIMPSGTRRSDGAFYTAVCNGLQISNTDRLSPKRGKDRLINFVKSRCGQANKSLMVMFIDCAQRLTRAEFDYLADVDEQLTDAKLRLFLVFVRQSDASGVEVRDTWSDYPSHMVRRWFMASHQFEPLTGIEDIAHALGRYDSEIYWPTPDVSFTRHFARNAFDELGWRLQQQAELLLDGVNILRAEVEMPATNAWPMQTFTHTVRYLLTNVAGRDPSFEAFTPAHVREALESTGYLRLEYVLANLVSLPEAA